MAGAGLHPPLLCPCAPGQQAIESRIEEATMNERMAICRRRLIGVLTMALFTATGACAQTAVHRTLTLDGAERVIAAAKMEAQKLQAPGAVIAVVDEGGNL